MADDTGLDFTDQINALELKYQQVNLTKFDQCFHLTGQAMRQLN